MSLPSSSLARSHSLLLCRLLWPTGVLLAVTLSMFVAACLWTMQMANGVSVDRQRTRLEAVLAQHLDATRTSFAAFLASGQAERLTSGSEGAPPYLALGADQAKSFGFDGIALVTSTSTGSERIPGLDRIVPLLGPRLALRGSDGSEAAQGATVRLLSDGQEHFEVAALAAASLPARLNARLDPSDLIVGWKRFGAETLTTSAALHGLKGISVVPASASQAGEAVPILDGAGEPAAALLWSIYRPGDMFWSRLKHGVLLGIVVAILLFVGVAFHAHQTTKNLTETEAVRNELLGRDPLSGLPNRLLFNERLDRELARVPEGGPGLAVMFIDLDRFKDVNDGYGHQVGDDLIRSVAERLSGLLSRADTLARLGGDEFAIIQGNVQSVEVVENLARRILDTLTVPFHIGDAQIPIGASIGVALAPEHARDRQSLMKLADTALYQAKSEGRNRRTIFQSRMDEAVRMRKVVGDDLRRAIEEDQLVLYYQPLYSSDGENIVGLEALIRWPHPERGMISPAEFIPVAEERGLIVPLGEWVLRRACIDGKRWPTVRVAVNVSPIQFRHRNFVETVMRVLEETGFDPCRLELELTEGVVVGDADAAEAAMIDLRGLGVHLALDDFGTGYSSLIYLRRFAFDKIKIDRSFLESMEATGESAILVHSIVHLGRALGLIVTAEGVETKEQHRFLQALGCHQLQGYLFSKPVPAAEIDRMLRVSPGLTASAA